MFLMLFFKTLYLQTLIFAYLNNILLTQLTLKNLL